MGTRSITAFIRKDESGKEKRYATIYRQYDGYPKGHGRDLAEFISGGKMVNGLPIGKPGGLIFNGMGCMAAAVVAHLKKEPGGIYLEPEDTELFDDDYTYLVISEPEGLVFECYKWGELVFKGTPQDFLIQYEAYV